MRDPAPTQRTCSAVLAKAKLAFATARGLDEATILRVLEVTRAELDDPDGRVPFAPASEFWAYVVRTLDDPGVPIQFAEAMSPNDLGVLGFAAMTATSGREALSRAVRYFELLGASSRLEIEEAGDGIRVEVARSGERTLAARVMTESTVATVLRVARSVTGADFDPLAVAFRHDAPHDVSAHRRFFRVAVRFGAEWDGLVVPRALLERVPSAANASMGSFFERHATEVLRRLRSSQSLVDRVRASIAQELTSGEPNMAAVARRLGASERTLRRQLDDENASFRALIDTVRRDLALEYLRDSNANVTEISYLLGFSEVSAFSRAFKRWYGESPRTYRRSS